MNWIEGALKATFIIQLLCFGLGGARIYYKQEKPAIKGFLIGAIGVGISMTAMWWLFNSLYQDAEKQAMPFTTAAIFLCFPIVCGAAILAILIHFRSGQNNLRKIELLFPVLFSVGGIFFSYYLYASYFRRNLPWSATEIHEYCWEDGFLPDYECYLKARVTREQFSDYIGSNNLDSGKNCRFENTVRNAKIDWWDPPFESGTCFLKRETGTNVTATYHSGFLYLHVITD